MKPLPSAVWRASTMTPTTARTFWRQHQQVSVTAATRARAGPVGRRRRRRRRERSPGGRACGPRGRSRRRRRRAGRGRRAVRSGRWPWAARCFTAAKWPNGVPRHLRTLRGQTCARTAASVHDSLVRRRSCGGSAAPSQRDERRPAAPGGRSEASGRRDPRAGALSQPLQRLAGPRRLPRLRLARHRRRPFAGLFRRQLRAHSLSNYLHARFRLHRALSAAKPRHAAHRLAPNQPTARGGRPQPGPQQALDLLARDAPTPASGYLGRRHARISPPP